MTMRSGIVVTSGTAHTRSASSMERLPRPIERGASELAHDRARPHIDELRYPLGSDELNRFPEPDPLGHLRDEKPPDLSGSAIGTRRYIRDRRDLWLPDNDRIEHVPNGNRSRPHRSA